MSFSVRTNLNTKHLKAIGKMKPITISPQEHETGEHEVQIDFNDKKHLNRFNRNLKNGKGVRINPSHFSHIHSQGGSLKSFGKSLKKGFTKVGNKISSVAQDVVKNPVFKAVVKEVAPTIAGEAMNAGTTMLTGNPALGKVAGKVAEKGTKAGLNSSGWGVHKSGMMTVPIGVKYGEGLSQATQNIGGNSMPETFGVPPSKMKERMAYVRSHKKGGSVVALGGSVMPLGGSVVALGKSVKPLGGSVVALGKGFNKL